MRLIVLNRKMAENITFNEKHIFISITDPKNEFPKLPKSTKRLSTLCLKFHDSDRDEKGYISDKKILFNKEDAMNILDTLNSSSSKCNLIICNCDAGISRSSAVAAAISKIFNNKDEYFFKMFYPNRFVYKTILQTLSDNKRKYPNLKNLKFVKGI